MSSREALRGLVEALQRIERSVAWDSPQWKTPWSPPSIARAALTAWNERERLGADLGLYHAALDVRNRSDGAVVPMLEFIDAHLFGTPTSGDTPTGGEAGNPTAEAASRGPDLSPSSVTPRACETWCGQGKHTQTPGIVYCSPACRDAGRALAPVGAKLEPMRGEVAEGDKKFVSGRQVLAHYGAVPKSAVEVPEEKCGTCGGRGTVLSIYARGPGDPPGNAMVLCPACGGSGT